MQLKLNSFRQDFCPILPWLWVKSLTFPWQLSNSPTFPGFPDKWSPCFEQDERCIDDYVIKSAWTTTRWTVLINCQHSVRCQSACISSQLLHTYYQQQHHWSSQKTCNTSLLIQIQKKNKKTKNVWTTSSCFVTCLTTTIRNWKPVIQWSNDAWSFTVWNARILLALSAALQSLNLSPSMRPSIFLSLPGVHPLCQHPIKYRITAVVEK